MKNLATKMSVLAITALLGFSISSCTTEDVNPSTTAPTNVVASTASNSSINVSWTRDASDVTTDTVIAIDEATATLVQTALTPAPGNSATLSGLVAGRVYDISVHSNSGASSTITFTIGAEPLNVAANSGSASSINVRWDRNSNDVATDTAIATLNGVVASTAIVAYPGNTATLNGLQTGQTYTITVHSGAAISSAIQWATAQRTTGIRLYETADNTPGHNSGLWLGAPGGPTSVSLVGSNGANSDLVLASDQTAPFADIIAADVTGSGLPSGKATIVGDTIAAIAGGLDALYYTGDLSSRFNNASNSINFPTTSSVPLVFLAKTTDGHYARIQVNPQANGGLVGVDPATNTYFVDLDVSYQTVADLAYASRPHPMQHDVARRYSILGK